MTECELIFSGGGWGDPAEVTHHFDAANQQLEACLLPRDISAATLDGTDDLESFMTVFFFSAPGDSGAAGQFLQLNIWH